MRLKKLELMGFKSFADKGVFEFDGPLTALVGPNGAGKSNVVDALKWVLGEQNARKLRGTEMADMIFKGTPSRRALGCAEVRLTLQNDRGLLPLEYDEVCIARRCYRSGESEYLLNGSPCRLKDIRMLFMDTGVGVSAYSVIEQGQVDMLLRADCKERRQILEEAAGINRYLQRKREAELKLERVRVNLQRVTDIVEELERQLRSVRYQAAKARRYERYRDELRTLRVALGLRSHRELAQEAARLAAKIEQTESSRLELEARSEELRGGLSTSHGQLEAVRSKLAQDEDRLSHAEARCYSLGQEIEMNLRRQAELQARQEELRERCAEAQSALESARAELAQTQEGLARVREALQARSDAHRESTEAARRADERSAELEARMEALKASVFELMQQESQLQNQIGMLSAERETLGNRIGRLAERERHLRVQCERARAEGTAAQEHMRSLRAESARLGAQCAALDEQISQFTARIEELTARGGECRAELKGKLGRRQVLQDLQSRAEGVGTGVRTLLDQIDTAGSVLAGCPGLLANLIEVGTSEAFAVEVALGPAVQSVLVHTRRQAREALRLLAEGGRGRAMVLALEDVRQGPRVELPDAGVRAVALSQLVRCPDCARPVVEALLGDCFLVASVEEALALVAHPLPAGVRIVTPSGECFEPGGFWSAGELETARLISRRSELAELDEQIRALQQDLDALSEEARRSSERVQALQRQRGTLAARRDELGRREEELRARISLLGSQQSQREEDLELLEAERKSLSEEIEQAGDRTSRASQQLETLREAQAERQAQLEAAQHESRRERTAREELAAELSTLRSELSRLEEQQSSLLALATRLEAEIERREREFALAAEELRASASREREAVEKVRAAQEARKSLEEQKAALEARIRQGVAARDKALEHISGLEAERDEVSSQLASVHRALEELRLKQSEVRLRGDSLRERVADEWGVRLECLELEPEQWRERPLFADAAIAEFQDAGGDGESPPVARWYREARGETANGQGEDGGPKLIGLAEAVALRDKVLAMVDAPETSWDEVKARADELRVKLERMGGANLDAIREQDELEVRAQFLANQRDDLETARRHEMEIIGELSRKSRQNFVETFEAVRQNFQSLVRKLFGGGTGDLVLEEDRDVLEAGIEIVVRPPGKETRTISLLSGGEKALAAVALLFAVFESKPSPFCILDEVDAPLDEANIGRFLGLIEQYAKNTQFVIVTHNKLTMSAARTLYGISLAEEGVSKKLVVNFEEVDRRLAEMTRETRLARTRAKAG